MSSQYSENDSTSAPSTSATATNLNSSNDQENTDPSPTNPKLYKTTLCQFYLQGPCKNGDKCSYAHGTSELRSSSGLGVAEVGSKARRSSARSSSSSATAPSAWRAPSRTACARCRRRSAPL